MDSHVKKYRKRQAFPEIAKIVDLTGLQPSFAQENGKTLGKEYKYQIDDIVNGIRIGKEI